LAASIGNHNIDNYDLAVNKALFINAPTV